jgi:hypothetical protein
MPNAIDEMCPVYVGERRIRLQLSEDSRSPRAFTAITIDADYSACEPEGIVHPLELLITTPTPTDSKRLFYNRASPSTISFRPREGGRHVIRIAEIGHNRWFGYIEIDVAGESASAQTVT